MNLNEMTNEELIALYRSTNDEYVKEYFFERNLKIVNDAAYTFFKYKKHRDIREDIMSEGYIGLIQAFHRYNLDAGIKFITFSSKCIHNAILMYLAKLKVRSKIHFHSIQESVNEEFTYEDILPSDNFNNDTYTMVNESLHNFFANGSDRDKKIYQMIVVEDKEQKEIAKELGLHFNTVSKIKKRIREILSIVDE